MRNRRQEIFLLMQGKYPISYPAMVIKAFNTTVAGPTMLAMLLHLGEVYCTQYHQDKIMFHNSYYDSHVHFFNIFQLKLFDMILEHNGV